MKPLYCDFETQSAINLRTVGTKQYLEHPSTRVMSAVFMDSRGKLTIWLPKFACPDIVYTRMKPVPKAVYIRDNYLPSNFWTAYTLVAHNAELFDRRVAVRFAACPASTPWVDTIALARANGYPAGLDGLLKSLGLPGKADDTAMKVLTQVKVSGGRYVYQTGTAPLWEKLVQYNIEDVTGLKAVYAELSALDNFDDEFYRIHCQSNAHGFKIDRVKLLELREAWSQFTSEAGDIIAEITGGELNGESIRSPAKVKQWFASLGFYLPDNSLSRQKLVDVFAHPERYIQGMGDDDGVAVIALLAERQNAVNAIEGKLNRILDEMDTSDRVRYSIVINGAHTGRDSARVVQIQNFARGEAPENETGDKRASWTKLVRGKWTLAAVKRAASEGKPVKPRDVLSALTRDIIIPSEGKSLVTYDYGQIEARVLFWLAGCEAGLSAFRDRSRDIYQDMANKVGAGRFMGKQIILACGYQMWIEKFELTCRNFGIDLRKLGLTARQCVMAYRDGYPEVPALWKAYENAALEAVRTRREQYAGRCEFSCAAGWLVVTLPSGDMLRYRDASIESMDRGYGPRDQVCWTNGYGMRRSLYGGILTENIDQAISNRLLKHAAKRVAKLCPDYQLLFRVHDELVYEVDSVNGEEALACIGCIMSIPPPWGDGIPLMCEGMVTDRYTKYPFSDTKRACYQLGVCV